MFVFFSLLSLAEKLSERVKFQNSRLTDLSSTEQAINNTSDAIDDLLDHLETSVKNSEETQRKVKMLKSVMRRIKVLKV